jgi:hypothetical protein
MILNFETLYAKYNGFVPWWPFNAKYDMILCLDDPNSMQNMMDFRSDGCDGLQHPIVMAWNFPRSGCPTN